ncbi:glycosyltransferase [candidate division WWE3 bacterium]|nr:glycosyltransferase [candidate division WWE3 bacterium]
MHRMTFFSIVIPVRTINDYIKENITHLKKLDYPSFEVLIITDKKEDPPTNDKRFKFISSGPVGPGEKRNLGVKKALGSVIAFLDDDAYPKSNWLREAERIFQANPTLYALGAPAITPKDCPLRERMSGRIYESYLTGGNTTYRYLPQQQRKVSDYPTVNLFVKKEAFEKVGGFPIEFWPGEDTKLCLDLVKLHGAPFLYDPAPIVYHHRRDVFLKHLKQVSRYGQHRGQFARIFPETSRLPFYFVPSLFILGLFFGPLTFLLHPIFKFIYFSVVFIYLGLLLLESLKVGLMEKGLKAFFYMAVGIFLTHVVYGWNFIWGYLKKPSLKLRSVDLKTGNYVGG